MTKFVIISQQRSGTNLLRSLLNSHPDIFCFGEMFIPSGEVWDKAMDVTEYRFPAFYDDKTDYISDEKYLTDMYFSKRKYGAVGFDLKYNQIIDEERKKLIIASDIKIIHLIRENLDTVLSEIWHEAIDNKDKFPIRISPTKIRKDINWIEHNIKDWDDLADFPLGYDEISNMDTLLNDYICEYLGVKPYKLTTALKKNKHDYSKLIKNYEKIQHVFG